MTGEVPKRDPLADLEQLVADVEAMVENLRRDAAIEIAGRLYELASSMNDGLGAVVAVARDGEVSENILDRASAALIAWQEAKPDIENLLKELRT